MKKIMTFVLLVGFAKAFGQSSKDSFVIRPDLLRQYYSVMLTEGDHRDQDSALAAKIQEQHLANITRLVNEGKVLVAGPFLDDISWKGFFIFDMDSKEAIEKELAQDKAISSGRLKYEIHPWMTVKRKVDFK